MGRKSSRSSYRSKGQYPVYSKATRKLIKLGRKDDMSYQADRIIAQERFLQNCKDERFILKNKIERALTTMTQRLFDSYKGRVCWGACVQAVKTDYTMNYADNVQHKIVNKPTQVHIKMNEVEKYRKYVV